MCKHGFGNHLGNGTTCSPMRVRNVFRNEKHSAIHRGKTSNGKANKMSSIDLIHIAQDK